MGISDDSKPSPSPPQYLEVTCKISGKTRRFAAGTDAGFAVALINRNLKGPIQVATHIEAVKDDEEPIAFGPNAILTNFGEGWKLQTVTINQSIPSEVRGRHDRGSPGLMRRFLVPRSSIENANVVQLEAEVEKMESFKFAFILKLMLKLFGITNELSKILQRKDLNIVLAMELVDDVKSRLATLRDSGWDNLFFVVQEFCVAKGIPVPNMDEEIPIRGRSRKEGRTITNLHHYRAEIFYVAIDKICVEMDHRFSEGSNNVLNCFSCLDPKNSFSRFDIDKLARLADIYHADFSDDDRGTIREQLDNYVHHMKMHASFTSCEDIESLAMKMVQTQKHLVFPLVYKLIELALLLPVSTASVERAFSAMKIIKSKLRNKINDEWFNDLMICYTEREIFKSLQDVDIMRTFTRKKSRKGHLPPNFI